MSRGQVSEGADPAITAGAGGDVAVTAVWFGVLGVVAGLLWWQLAPEVVATRAEAGASLEADQWPRQVGVDGWYALMAAVGGALSGVVLPWWRRRRPVLMVLLVTLGGVVAAVLSLQVGAWAGPPDVATVLADQDVGARAPLDLRLQAGGLFWVWSTTAALGALVYLVVRGPDPVDGDDPQAPSDSAPGAAVTR